MSDLDPNLTFESFVVGPANRLASAAARRAADSPGTSYNPLFVYSASGLGKTHILTAIAHLVARQHPERRLEYMALERFLDRLESALEGGQRDGGSLFDGLDILLLDDVQFLTGQLEAQEMLLRTLDTLSTQGSQVVLASDRPPVDIDGLDARLLSRFSGGLIVDIGVPDYETRVAILRKKAHERGQSLEAGVAEALARHPFRNVRELGGGLNKVLATQELEERRVRAEEIPLMLGSIAAPDGGGPAGEFDSFLDELVMSLAEVVEEKEEPWRRAFREVIDEAEREGFSTLRVDGYPRGNRPEGWEDIVSSFRADIERLRQIENELDELRNPWPDAAAGVLKDPDRLQEAESLLASVRERQRPFPRLTQGQTLADLTDYPPLVVKAAAQLVGRERPEYNPLFLLAPDRDLGCTVLGAAGRTYQAVHTGSRLAVTSAQAFADDFIRALGEGVAGAWRERWWTLDLLLVHGVEALSEMERAQEEFFHLFEALKRRGARVMLVADRSPSDISGIDDRLRSRFEGGLLLGVTEGTPGSDLVLEDPTIRLDGESFLAGLDLGTPTRSTDTGEGDTVGTRPSARAPSLESVAPVVARSPEAPAPKAASPAVSVHIDVTRGGADESASSDWRPSPENVVLVWPRIGDLLIEELD